VNKQTTTWLSVLSFGSLVWSACSSGLPPEKSNDAGAGGDTGGAHPSGATGGKSAANAGGNTARGGASEAGESSRGGDRGIVGNGGSGDAVGSGGEGGGAAASGGESASGGVSSNAGAGESDAGSGGQGAGSSTSAPGRICTPESLYEPNESAGNPCWIKPNMTITSALVDDDIDDYFSIDLEKNVTYTLDMVSSRSGNRGFTMTVDGKIDPLIEYGFAASGTSHSEFTPKASGRAILRLNGSMQYQFTVWDSRVEHDTNFEPNNSPSLAAEIEIGQAIDQALTSREDDYDYYRFEVVSGQTYTFEFTHATSIYRGISQIVEGEPYDYLKFGFVSAGATHEEFVARATGEAVLELHGLTSYQFQILAADPEHDAVTYEPNNSPSTAAPVELGAVVTSELGTTASDNTDYFSVPVKANTTYILHLERPKSLYRGLSVVTKTGSTVRIEFGFVGSGKDDASFTTPAADGFALLRLEGATNYTFSIAPQ
jgi:hypothetical protein